MKILSFLFFATYLLLDGKTSAFDVSNNCDYYYSKSLKKKIYTSLEIEPEFPGGVTAYARFLNKNLLTLQDTEGDLASLPMPRIKFIVDTDGQIKKPCIQNRSDSLQLNSLEKAALELINKMPKWIPGKCHGKVVAGEVIRPLAICIKLETD
ncbi:energy transducer TonB [Pseudobacter ginsenosidimutans]|uniref:TonB-like protein n=1 Tax=Pseudobacter ginsenosidimutans TaxID=661488 RepID=A0A4Q7N4T5_9BACT|nr:hypothetical protein [Pseudobacter ginsenosidimutans]QEC44565.1 hypothetical protein FSB84_23875 [Pseudobacter ginsenosidimutans]RZS76043.1 hypothetical protein EV199_1920 [Pseudobacter ginsenosidimutans]